MFVDILRSYGEGNIVAHKDCVSYYYMIKPINSLYASETQLDGLIENLMNKILSVNMAGAIYILPKRINEQAIIQHYEDLFQKNGNNNLINLKNSVIKDIKKQLAEKIRYRYTIWFVFCDNREPLKRKMFSDIIKKTDMELDDRMIELSSVVEEQIYKKLSADLTVDKPTKEMIEELHNYLAIPIEQKTVDYFTTPNPTNLVQEYQLTNESEFRKIYSQILIAERVDYNKTNGDRMTANTVVNRIQEYDYPVDTIIKFDLEHTATFKRSMSAKKTNIKKSAKRYSYLAERDDNTAREALQLAKIGENVDESIEDSKVRWQMIFRVRANDEKMLSKRSDRLRKRFEGAYVPLTYAIGDQEKLANQLFPYKSCYASYMNLTDVLFFAHFNYLGGLYIGEEEKGIIGTYTNQADLPVLIDVEAPVKGKAKSGSSTSLFVGETGAGKSQVANNLMMLSMIFYGHKVLVVDPKGDRENIIRTLNTYGDIASHLVIGDKNCPSGMFDPFLLHPNDQNEALAIAKNDIMSLVRAVNKDQVIHLLEIDKAYDDMLKLKNDGKIKQLTLTVLGECLLKRDRAVAENLLSLRKDPMARLFFGDDDTDISNAFRIDRPYNLITFARLPVYSTDEKTYRFQENNLEHSLFALIIAKTTEITNRFIRLEKGKPKTLGIDEAKLWSTVPGGIDVLINNNLIARSELMNLSIILQNWSDIPNSIINNSGQFFIGNMKSKEEIEHILNHFDLGKNTGLASMLMDRTKYEGMSEHKKFNFLYVDYNNRKAVTKLKFLDTFSKAFNTLKKEEVSV